uniref:Uncharacterized protein n=1 Tax=Amphimedon queenslandica TaxID=400682 RepID=A0A1X7SJ89_AMPQE
MIGISGGCVGGSVTEIKAKPVAKADQIQHIGQLNKLEFNSTLNEVWALARELGAGTDRYKAGK